MLKRLTALLLTGACCISLFAGCGAVSAENSVPENSADTAEDFADLAGYVDFDQDDLNDNWAEAGSACEIVFSGDQISVSGSGASADGTTVTINSPGLYHISGQLNDGQLVVDSAADGKVWIVLDGAQINCSTSAAVWIQQADKTVITLAQDSTNLLSDGETYQLAEGEDEPNASLFSKDDLTINGSGTLYVTGNWSNGIQSKDDLRITGGTLIVQASNNGIKGKDRLGILEGSINVDCEGNALQSDNETDAGLGLIYIAGGSINANAAQDGIEATSYLLITGGDLVVTTGGGNAAAAAQTQQETHMPEMSGAVGADASGTDSQSLEDSVSMKGLKADIGITILGGNITVDSADDSVHTNDSITIADGVLNLSSGDDAVHADSFLSISSGTISVLNSYEGLEAAQIEISGGDLSIQSDDDGLNAADGTGSEMARPGTAESAAEDAAQASVCSLTITGGKIYIDSDADGIDSNGTVSISGGEIRIEGPVSGADSALDYDLSFEMTGGTLTATGNAGMAQTVSSLSGVCGVTVWLSEQADASDTLSVLDSAGNTVMTVTSSKSYAHAVLVSPVFTDGETYTVLLNEQELGSFTADAQSMATIGSETSFSGRPSGDMGGRPGGMMPGSPFDSGSFGADFENRPTPPDDSAPDTAQ